MITRILLLVFLLHWLAGCQPIEGAFKIGITRWLGYEPFYVAEQLNHYPDIDVVRLSSTLDVLRALRNGNLQGAGLTLDETLTLIDEGIDLQVVIAVDYSNGADVLMAAPSITSLRELVDKRIAVETNAVGALVLRNALQKAELTHNQVKILSMSVSQMKRACEQQHIDAAITYQPYGRELAGCGMRQLYSSADMLGQIVDLLVVRRDALPMQKKMEQLVHGYYKTLDYLAQHPFQAKKRMAENLGETPANIERDMALIHVLDLAESKAALASQSSLYETAQALNTAMLEQGLLRKSIDMREHVDNRWMPEAVP